MFSGGRGGAASRLKPSGSVRARSTAMLRFPLRPQAAA